MFKSFTNSLISALNAVGGSAGFNPMDPYRFVPIAGRRNIGRDILKASRNSKTYRDTNRVGSRQQERFATQLFAGRIVFFDHDANRRMIAERAAMKELHLTMAPEIRDHITAEEMRSLINDPTIKIREHVRGGGKSTLRDYQVATIEALKDMGAIDITTNDDELMKIREFASSRAEGMEPRDDELTTIVEAEDYPGVPIPAEDPRLEVDRDTFKVHEIPHGLKEGDMSVLKMLITECVAPAPGAARDRLKRAGFIEYVGKAWVVTGAGHALSRDGR